VCVAIHIGIWTDSTRFARRADENPFVDAAFGERRAINLYMREPARTVMHKPGTAHFRCRCGQRVTFSTGSLAITPLAHLRKNGDVKTGECPVCGLKHAVRGMKSRAA
jgi:hypothetical protein